MSKYWNLKKADEYSAATELMKRLPDLGGLDTETMWDAIRFSDLEIYKIKNKPVPLWLRLTLPFGLVAAVVLFIGLPVNFMFTGQWGYNWLWLKNWFSALGF